MVAIEKGARQPKSGDQKIKQKLETRKLPQTHPPKSTNRNLAAFFALSLRNFFGDEKFAGNCGKRNLLHGFFIFDRLNNNALRRLRHQ